MKTSNNNQNKTISNVYALGVLALFTVMTICLMVSGIIPLD